MKYLFLILFIVFLLGYGIAWGFNHLNPWVTILGTFTIILTTIYYLFFKK